MGNAFAFPFSFLAVKRKRCYNVLISILHKVHIKGEVTVGDVFIEQIVKKQNEGKDFLIKLGITLVGVILAAAIFFLLLTPFPYKEYVGMIVFLIFVGVLYYTWYIVSGLNLEFEYIFTNGDLDIDKISNKRKRKRMTTVRMTRVESMEECDLRAINKEKYDHFYNATSWSRAANMWCMEYTNRDGERCCLVFNPSEKMLEAIRKFYRPRTYKA